MDLNSIHKNKNDYYKLANDYLANIDSNELDISFDEIILKSISILIDHDFIPTPCIEIRLGLQNNQIKVGNYLLYIDENKQFVDEFIL